MYVQILQEVIFKTGRQSSGKPIKAVKTGFLWEGKDRGDRTVRKTARRKEEV